MPCLLRIACRFLYQWLVSFLTTLFGFRFSISKITLFRLMMPAHLSSSLDVCAINPTNIYCDHSAILLVTLVIGDVMCCWACAAMKTFFWAEVVRQIITGTFDEDGLAMLSFGFSFMPLIVAATVTLTFCALGSPAFPVLFCFVFENML